MAVPTGTFSNDITLTTDEKLMLFVTFNLSTAAITGLWSSSDPVDPITWPMPTQAAMLARAPKLSPDGLFLVIADGSELRAFTRSDRGAAWIAAPSELVGLATPAGDDERPGTITRDGTHMIVYRRTSSGSPFQLYEHERAGFGQPWSPVDTLAAVDLLHPFPTYSKLTPHLTADGLTLVYAAQTTQAGATSKLYLTTRTSLGDPFVTPSLIAEISDPDLNDGDPWLSEDGSRLWFTRYHDLAVRTDDWGIYVSELEPQ